MPPRFKIFTWWMIKWAKTSLIDIPFTHNAFLDLKTRDACQWNERPNPLNIEIIFFTCHAQEQWSNASI